MSGDMSNKKRLILITEGCLRNNLLYLSGHHDFFPKDCYGPSNRRQGEASQLTLVIEGLAEKVQTDIPLEARNGTPRAFFRKRSWTREFFAKHEIRPGDVIAVERTGQYAYRVYPFETKNVRAGAAIPDHWPELDQSRPAAIDLFAGCGGFSLGLKDAGFENLLAVEWDESCCRTFAENVSTRILQCAIQEIESFPNCDILVGGPPCQGFSNLGERIPNDPRRQLWRHYLRAVADSHPLIFVMENVPPLLKSAEYQEIKREAEQLGYQIEAAILNAANYGVPEQRKRVIITASRIGEPVFPKPTNRDPATYPTFETQGLPRWRTVKDAIGDMPKDPDGKNWHIGRNPTEKSRKRYRCIPPGGNRWNLPPELMPECWKRKTEGGTDLFGRLSWDKPSVTIRTEFFKPEKGRYLHPSENRPITHREAARLQGFNDSFNFLGTKIEVARQIGNAVPPPLALQIARTAMAEIRAYYASSKGTRQKSETTSA